MWNRLKHWRRSRILANARLDENDWKRTLERFEFTRLLTPEEQASLRDLVILFLHEKRFAATHDLQLTQAMRLHIAVQACILILYLGLEYYRGWSEIIVYPAEFVPRHQYMDEAGVVHQGEQPYSGEAWLQGPVILSWADVAQSEHPDGVNVVIHEFAHKLDMLNGNANGFPPLHKGMSREMWSQALSSAYADFCARVDRMENTEIDPYASESPGEFFAVISEVFFEIPDLVADEYPQVYRHLAEFYRQDPLARLQRHGIAPVSRAAVPAEA
jgi:Mlc titration factor MtfA (ptsG expression regulator)